MKKSSLLSLSALLALSVFLFTACPGDEGDETKTFTVTFDADGGTSAPAPVKVEEGKTITLPATNPTRTDYDFAGWFTAQNGGGTAFTAATVVSADITVYAYWTEQLVDVTGYSFTEDVEGDTMASHTTGIVARHTASTLTLASAKRGKVTNTVYITITGSVPVAYQYNANGTTARPDTDATAGDKFDTFTWFGTDTGHTPAAGKYGAVYINGIFSGDIEGKAYGLKQTNQAQRIFTGWSYIKTEVTGPAVANANALCIPTDTSQSAYRWTASSIKKTATSPLGLLIWNGTSRTITLELAELTLDASSTTTNLVLTNPPAIKPNGATKKIIIDYSAVTFANQ